MDAVGSEQPTGETPQAIDGHALAEDLAQELQCGCCSELVYKPVVVIPCDHFFCGRYAAFKYYVLFFVFIAYR